LDELSSTHFTGMSLHNKKIKEKLKLPRKNHFTVTVMEEWTGVYRGKTSENEVFSPMKMFKGIS